MKRDFTNRYGKLPLKAILLSLLIIFVCASAFCGCVSAAGTENEVTVTISGNDYTNWTYLVDNLSSTDKSKVTVKLDCDIDNGSYWRGITEPTQILAKGLGVINISSGDKTLDLNGHNINLNSSNSPAKTNDYFILFNVTNGSNLTIKNSGTNGENYIAANVTAMIVVSDGSDFTLGNNVNLTIYGKPNLPVTPPTTLSMVIGILAQNETDAAISDVKLEEGSIVNDHSEYDNVYAIYIVQRGFLAQNIPEHKEVVDKDACGVNLEISGTVNGHRGILLHGYVQNVDPSAPNVTICESAEINAEKGSAIVTCGYGNWNFKGGKVTGHDALMINSGKFTITGGDFSGNGGYVNEPSPSVLENGGEQNTSAAITVVGDNQFIGNVSITITGGTFTSSHGYAFYESDTKTNEYNKGTALKKLSITGGTFTGNKSLYPMYILMNGTVDEGVYVSLNDQTPFYPGLNTSLFTWAKGTDDKLEVTLKDNIVNVESIDLRHVLTGNIVTLNKKNHNFVKVSKDDKYLFEGWSNDTSKLGPDTKEFYVNSVYKPI
ncbi:MAG TPA: hypothetical protein O0W90_04755, partial [Methanocorpusculum sp.]|nr:hypothetical protein [Methanocorpusculum sp.]